MDYDKYQWIPTVLSVISLVAATAALIVRLLR